MPGSKRKIDEDTWIVSQSKKFKQGMLLSNVYETTLAHLRLGARQFFNSLLMRPDLENTSENGTTVSTPGSSPTGSRTPPSYNTPPGSPVATDIISDNELQNVLAPPVVRPITVCQDCVFRTHNSLGSEDYYGKCTYCEKLVCHLSTCRGCSSDFCRDCCITKYDTSAETYECYSCLH